MCGSVYLSFDFEAQAVLESMVSTPSSAQVRCPTLTLSLFGNTTPPDAFAKALEYVGTKVPVSVKGQAGDPYAFAALGELDFSPFMMSMAPMLSVSGARPHICMYTLPGVDASMASLMLSLQGGVMYTKPFKVTGTVCVKTSTGVCLASQDALKAYASPKGSSSAIATTPVRSPPPMSFFAAASEASTPAAAAYVLQVVKKVPGAPFKVKGPAYSSPMRSIAIDLEAAAGGGGSSKCTVPGCTADPAADSSKCTSCTAEDKHHIRPCVSCNASFFVKNAFVENGKKKFGSKFKPPTNCFKCITARKAAASAPPSAVASDAVASVAADTVAVASAAADSDAASVAADSVAVVSVAAASAAADSDAAASAVAADDVGNDADDESDDAKSADWQTVGAPTRKSVKVSSYCDSEATLAPAPVQKRMEGGGGSVASEGEFVYDLECKTVGCEGRVQLTQSNLDYFNTPTASGQIMVPPTRCVDCRAARREEKASNTLTGPCGYKHCNAEVSITSETMATLSERGLVPHCEDCRNTNTRNCKVCKASFFTRANLTEFTKKGWNPPNCCSKVCTAEMRAQKASG